MLFYLFKVGLGDIDTGITQAFDTDGYHGLVGIYLTEFAFQSLERATGDVYGFAYLKDTVLHLDHGFGMTEHVLQPLNLMVGDGGGGILAGVGDGFVNQ